MTVESFVWIVWTIFEKIEKGEKFLAILAIFELILAMFLTFKLYYFDAFEHRGAPLGVKWLCKVLWKSYGQFLRNFKFSWKGREEKKQKNDTIE